MNTRCLPPLSMKEEPLHAHILVTKSCLKTKESSQGSQDETITSSSSQGCDDCFIAVDAIVKTGMASTVIRKKKVSFGRKASRKVTMSRQQFTKQERRNTWYTSEELHTMYLEASDEDNSCLDTPASKTEPRPLSRHTWSLVRTTPGKTIQEGHKYLTTKDHADRMGLTRQNVSPAANTTQLSPMKSSSIVRSNQKTPVQDYAVKTPTMSPANRRAGQHERVKTSTISSPNRQAVQHDRVKTPTISPPNRRVDQDDMVKTPTILPPNRRSSIFAFVQKKFQRRSVSIMKPAKQQLERQQ